jgi:hypothetical protein
MEVRPGAGTCTYEVTRHARRTREVEGLPRFSRQSLSNVKLGFFIKLVTITWQDLAICRDGYWVRLVT